MKKLNNNTRTLILALILNLFISLWIAFPNISPFSKEIVFKIKLGLGIFTFAVYFFYMFFNEIIYAIYFACVSVKNIFKWIWKELKDWHTVVLFIIVVIVVGVEVWLPILLGIIFNNGWLIAFGSTCEAFWLAPLTPFLPLCMGITIAIKKPIMKLINKRKEWKKIKWLL